MNKTKKTALWALVYFVFWLLLSGHYDLFHTSIGVLCSLGIALMHSRLQNHLFFRDQQSEWKLRPFFFLLQYLPWLVWQIILSAWTVAKAVLKPGKIDPQLVKFTVDYKNNAAKVILANSITLTPGTITVFLDEQNFLVHGLLDDSAGSLVDGSFQAQIRRNYEPSGQPCVSAVQVIKSRKELL
jgi:multicomponent Na+:H+ antiporter subunit E